MHSLTGVFSLKSQITAQEKRNVDLATSNTSLRKANVELVAEKKKTSLPNSQSSSPRTRSWKKIMPSSSKGMPS